VSRIAFVVVAALLPAMALAQSASDLPAGLDADDLRARGDAPDALREKLVLAGPVDGASYRLGPGDVLTIQLWGRVTRTAAVEIGPEGTAILPESGMLSVGGMTLDQARARILDRLRGEYRDVRIEVQLTRPRTFRLQISGAVTHPGPVEASGSARVADALGSDALLPGASRRCIEVMHRDGTRERADLERLSRLGDPSRNPLLRDGDIVQVPYAMQFVEVSGAVAVPGRFERAPDDSLRTLLDLAGGALPSTAPEGALWVHWETPTHADTVRVSLDDVRDGTGDRAVSDGDRLYLYFVPDYLLQHQVVVLGEVARPGAYPIREGATRISEILRAAGGFLPTADLSAIRVHRVHERADERDPELERLLRLSRGELTASEYEALRTKLAGQREDYRVSWDAITRDPTSLDLLLRDRDTVHVDRLVSSIRVDGEVRRPAIITYRPGLSVQDYVRDAGGFTNRAWPGKVRVTRAVTGQTLLARNVRTLDPGDLIWVPERPDVTTWQQAKDVLGVLAQAATIVIAIRSVR